MKRTIGFVLALLVLLAAQTVAFAGQAELSDIIRPVDAWLYTTQ
jgi:hypothetical protein